MNPGGAKKISMQRIPNPGHPKALFSILKIYLLSAPNHSPKVWQYLLGGQQGTLTKGTIVPNT